MIELNNENKAKFFAQYWKQEILTVENARILFGNINQRWESGIYDFTEQKILLKPLSSISDEDAKYICLDLGLVNAEKKYIGENFITYNGDSYSVRFYYEGYVVVQQYLTILHIDTKKANDLAVSLGYYIQWMGLKSERAIEAGWIKFKEA